MCGFVTVYNPNSKPSASVDDLNKMCNLIHSRGPDHYGTYHDENLITGSKRLSIIDLSSEANLPFQKGDHIISYNGEVYNFLEIKESLIRERNIAFNTSSDTEVILESYLAYGVRCLSMFNGMFAFTIWNIKNKSLFVARDRLGIKPLFISKQNDNYYFASDIKSLWHKIDPLNSLNYSSVLNFFGQGYISKNQTSTKGIHKFPSGHYWILEDKKDYGPKRYWDIEFNKNRNLSFNDTVERTEELIEDSVKIRLRSDVPLGTFLSGGIDSTIVSGYTKKILGNELNTFSVGFDSANHDESKYSTYVASRLKTTHENIQLNKTALNELPSIIWNFSELYSDSSSIPTFFVSRLASQKLKVVLTGDGADEIFGGYIDPFAFYLLNNFNRLPSFFRKSAKKLILKNPSLAKTSLAKFFMLSDLDLEKGYLFLRGGNWNQYGDFFNLPIDEMKESLTYYLNELDSDDNVQRLIYADIKDRLQFDFLHKIDMGSMAHSLEARSPFLDYRLFDFAFSLDHKILYHGFKRKAVLKKIAQKFLSKRYINRRKMGFSIPKYEWLAAEDSFKKIKNILNRKSSLDQIMNRKKISEIITEFERGNQDHSNRIWQLLTYQIWEGIFLSRVYSKKQKLSDL